jgi:hypothetical protein
MSLDARAIAEHVYEVERRIDLDHPDWRGGDLHWWPLYRLEFYRRLFVAGASPASAPGRRALLAARNLEGAAPGQASVPTVWLVSDGISWQAMGQNEVERFCTPLAAACERLGFSPLLIDRASARARVGGGASRWRWIAPSMARSKAGALAAAHLRPNRQHDRLCAAMRAAAKGVGVGAVPTPRAMDARARAVSAIARGLARHLRIERPRAVFVVSYYDVTGYAFVAAAAREGIPAVDVQHGVAGELHPGYANWQRLPRGGYRLLPRWFWTWSAGDAAVIQDWGERAEPPHRAVVGGHPFLEAWRQGLMKPDPAMHAALEGLKHDARDRPRVLVTLQPSLDSGAAIEPLRQAMATRPDCAWWLRLHPAANGQRQVIDALLRGLTLPCVDVDRASAMPLPLLLSTARVHATHSSSAVIEAALLGLPSIVWSNYGAELFERELRDGSVLRAETGAAFAAALTSAAATSVATTARPDRLDSALRTLLGTPA